MTADRRVEAARPRASWGAFPLSELAVLAGLGLAALAIAWWGEARGLWVAAAGVALGSLAGLEVAVREHFARYRSHAGLLAVAAAMAVSVPAAFALHLAAGSIAALGVATFALAFTALRQIYTRRAGPT